MVGATDPPARIDSGEVIDVTVDFDVVGEDDISLKSCHITLIIGGTVASVSVSNDEPV